MVAVAVVLHDRPYHYSLVLSKTVVPSLLDYQSTVAVVVVVAATDSFVAAVADAVKTLPIVD